MLQKSSLRDKCSHKLLTESVVLRNHSDIQFENEVMQDDTLSDSELAALSITDLVKTEALTTRGLPNRRTNIKRDAETTRFIERCVRSVSHWHEVRFGTPLPDPSCTPPTEQVLVGYMFDHLDLELFGPQLFDASVDVRPAIAQQQAVQKELVERGFRTGTELPTPGSLETTIKHLQLAYENVDRAAYKAPMVKTLRNMLRAYCENLRVTQARAQPLIGENLTAILATCDRTNLGLRDRALILFVLSVGEFTAASISRVRVEHLSRQADGTYAVDIAAAELRPRNTKIGLSTLLEGEAALAMDAWLSASNILSGPLFCGTTSRKVFISKATQEAKALNFKTCHAMLKARADEAGLKGNFYWSSFYLTAPNNRAVDGSRALPRSWKLQNQLQVKAAPQARRHAADSQNRPSSADTDDWQSKRPLSASDASRGSDPVLVFIDQKAGLTSYDFKFTIEDVAFTATWGNWVRLGLRDSKTTVAIEDAFVNGDAIEETYRGHRLALDDLSPVGRAALFKLFGLLPVETKANRASRIDSFLASPAGREYRIWADFVSWDGPEEDPRVTAPTSVFAQWLNGQNDSPIRAAMRSRRFVPPGRR